jgi:glycosyltransferase involved in cell wall biosynthesis
VKFRNTVTVLIHVYQRRNYLRSAVASALNQNDPPDEIVVTKAFDDPELDQFLKENKVRSIRVGQCTVGEQLADAISKVRTDVICFLDDDDEFTPDKVHQVRQIFNRFSDRVTAVRNEPFPIGETASDPPPDDWFRPTPLAKDMLVDPNHFTMRDYRQFVRHPPYNMSTLSIRREALDPALPILPDLTHATDHFFSIAALCQGDMYLTHHQLSLYRVHESASHDTSGRAANSDLLRFPALMGLVDRMSKTPLVALWQEDLRSAFSIRLANSRLVRPTPADWKRYVRSYFRRRQGFMLTDGVLALKRSLWMGGAT